MTQVQPRRTRRAALPLAALLVIAVLPGRANAATPSLKVADLRVVELDAAGLVAQVTVTLSSAATAAVTADFATANGTARAPADYTAKTGTVSLPAGTLSKKVQVPIAGDLLDEPNERFKLTLSNPVGATLADATGVVTIADDDPLPRLQINDPGVAEGDTGSKTMTFSASLNRPSGRTVTVLYAFTPSRAAVDSDYSLNADTGALTFPPGVTKRTVVATVFGDTEDEANETVNISLLGPLNATVVDALGRGRIVDDDGPGISVADGAGPEAGSVAFPITLSAPSPQAVTVTYTAGNDVATAPGDFAPTRESITIPAGSTEGVALVPAVQDGLDEIDERLGITLSQPRNGTLGESTAEGVIDDDDGPAASVGDVSTFEGGGGTAFTFPVTLSAASVQAVSVDWETVPGTATPGEGDYFTGSGTVTFEPGAVSKNVAVTVIGDVLAEGEESFSVELSNPVDGTVGDGVGVGTIQEDDCSEGNEGAGNSVNLGDLNGDAGTPQLSPAGFMVCGGGDVDWYRFTLREDSSGTKDLTARIELNLGAPQQSDGNLDLCVFSPSTTLIGCSTNTGFDDEEFVVRKADTFADDSVVVYLRVRGHDNGQANFANLFLLGNVTTDIPPNL